MPERPAQPDVSALSASFSAAEVAAYRAERRSRGLPPPLGQASFPPVAAAVAVFVVGLVLNWMLRDAVERAGLDPDPVTNIAVPLTFAATIAGGVFGWVFARDRAIRRELRLVRTAEANGFEYHRANRLRPAGFVPPSGRGPDRALPPGLVFQFGAGREEDEHFASTSGRETRFGNYSYRVGGSSDDSPSTRNWGYLAVRLDAPLPHMVLDAKGNNGLFGTNLPTTFARDQVLSLEGDFDRYFTLYAPRRYERDALYVFTPDLMALLIDHGAAYDVELVDDWIIFYIQGSIDVTNPGAWRRLFRLIDTVAAKAIRQGSRYRDERVEDAAPEESRRSSSVVTPDQRRTAALGSVEAGFRESPSSPAAATPDIAAARATAASLAAAFTGRSGTGDMRGNAMPTVGRGVGPAGRRLRRALSPSVLIGGLVVLALLIWSFTSGT